MPGRTVSKFCIDLIKSFEGYRSKAYKDSAGIWTIGYGTIRVNGQPVTQGMTCTAAQAEKLLLDKLHIFEADVNHLVKVPISQNQFDALCDFAYNAGSGALASSTLLRHINAQRPIVEARFTDWNKITVNGKKVAVDGLTRRRKAEYHLFMTPDHPVGLEYPALAPAA